MAECLHETVEKRGFYHEQPERRRTAAGLGDGFPESARGSVVAVGEKYNIFRVLGITRKGTEFHFKLLYELPSPSGCHGMGDAFLRVSSELVLDGKTYYAQTRAFRMHRILDGLECGA